MLLVQKKKVLIYVSTMYSGPNPGAVSTKGIKIDLSQNTGENVLEVLGGGGVVDTLGDTCSI